MEGWEDNIEFLMERAINDFTHVHSSLIKKGSFTFYVTVALKQSKPEYSGPYGSGSQDR